MALTWPGGQRSPRTPGRPALTGVPHMNQHGGTSTRRGFVRLGPQAQRAYQQLYRRIMAGLLTPGTRLLRQTELARALGVSLLTLRQALAQLEQDGLIATHQGRGTFVQAPVPPTV